MKNSIFTRILTLLVISGTAWSCSQNQYAQSSEYDDMYFTASDRTTVLPLENALVVKQDDKKYQYEADSYSARTVNPDYVSKYNVAETESSENSGEEYFVEGYNSDDARVNIYNSYDTPRARYNPYASYADPFSSGYYGYNNRQYSSLDRRHQGRWWRPGVRLSFNWGRAYSYRNGSRYYDSFNNSPFYNGYGSYSRYYSSYYRDPFCAPSYASYHGYGSYNSYYPHSYRNSYYSGFSNGYYSGKSYSKSENRSGRNIVRGGRIGSRGNIADNSNRSSGAIIRNKKGSANRSSTIGTNGARKYNSVRTTENELNRSSVKRRNTPINNGRRVTPVTRTRRTYDSNRVTPRNSSSQGRNSRSYTPTRRNSSTPSRRSYSAPSRSTPSRSSGSSYKSSSPSRSSGSSSRSYSSGSSNRSSSSSSRSSSSSSSSRSSSSRSKR